MDIPKNIASKLTRPVAILGWGVSGKGVAQLLKKLSVPFVIYDEFGGENVVLKFDWTAASSHDLAVYSPGFPQEHAWLKLARRANVTCLGELDFASLFWREPIVAITGTNGKTTLTEFLVFAHKRNGREAVAVGNIGYPLSRMCELEGSRLPLPVCEVSSFQAEDMRCFAPSAVLWTNFAEDHLDRHPSLEAYFRAKMKLVERLASRRLIVGESVVEFAKKIGMDLPEFTEVATRAEVAETVPLDSFFARNSQRENYAIARRHWLGEGLPVRALDDAARLFKPASHRLENVAAIGGVTFWNDSKATNFHAVLAALDDLKGAPIHWIGGGKTKGGNIPAFANEVSRRIKSASLIGESAPELHGVFQENGTASAIFQKLPDAISAAQKNATAGEIVLFSPGFSSFDMFKNYADRGNIFEQAIFSLKKTPAVKKNL